MKMKKVFSVLLVLVMMLQLIPKTAMADNSTPYYVALGDSIAYGFGLPDSDSSAVGMDVWSNIYSSAQDCYPRLVANAIAQAATGDPEAVAANNTFANLGIPGAKLVDYNYFLGNQDSPSSYNFFQFFITPKQGSEGGDALLGDLKEAVTEEIAKADMITYQVGSNDMLFDVIVPSITSDNPLIQLTSVVIIAGALGVGVEELYAMFGSLLNQIQPIESNTLNTNANTGSSTEEALISLLSTVTEEDVAEFLQFVDSDNLVSMMKESVANAAQYYEPTISALKTAAPNASIAVVGAMNPYGSSVEYKGVRYTNAQIMAALIAEFARIAMQVVQKAAAQQQTPPMGAPQGQSGIGKSVNFNLEAALTASAAAYEEVKASDEEFTFDAEAYIAGQQKTIAPISIYPQRGAGCIYQTTYDTTYDTNPDAEISISSELTEGILYSLIYHLIGAPTQEALNDLNWACEEAAAACGVPFVYILDKVNKTTADLTVHPDAVGHQAIADAITDVLISDLTFDSNLINGSPFSSTLGVLPTTAFYGRTVTVDITANVDYVVANNTRIWDKTVNATRQATFTVTDPTTYIYAHCSGPGVMQPLSVVSDTPVVTVLGDSIASGFSAMSNPCFAFHPEWSYYNSYPSYLADKIQTKQSTDVDLNNLGKVGFSSAELLEILGRDDAKYRVTQNPENNLIPNIYQTFSDALAEANIVVMNVAADDFLLPLVIYLQQAMGADFSAANMPDVFNEFAVMLGQTPGNIDMATFCMWLTLCQSYQPLNMQVSDMGSAINKELLRQEFERSFVEYKHNQARIFAELDKRLGADVERISVGMYNPMDPQTTIKVATKNYFVDFDVDCPIGALLESAVVAGNACLDAYSDAYGWTMVDVTGVETGMSTGGMDPHPTTNGHKDIADRIYDALYPEIEPVDPGPTPSGGGGGGASTSQVPVSGDKDSVKIEATVSGTNATIKDISSEQIETVGTGEEVTIDLTGLKSTVSGVTIPKTTMENVAESNASGLKVVLPNGNTAVFDKTTLNAIAEQAKSANVQLVIDKESSAEKSMNTLQKAALESLNNPFVINAYFSSNGNKISDFKGGKADITTAYQTTSPVRVWYIADSGIKTLVPSTFDGKSATFTVEHFSHYAIEELAGIDYATCAKDDSCLLAAYKDVKATAWYHDGVHYCLQKGLMNGATETTFAPSQNATRAMIATVLYRLAGSPTVEQACSYSDVLPEKYYADAVAWAEQNNIVTGYPSGKFGPKDAVTREQMATIFYRFAQYMGVDVTEAAGGSLSFSDAGTSHEYSAEALQWMCNVGLMNGIDSKLAPRGNTSRSQTATILQRFCETFR